MRYLFWCCLSLCLAGCGPEVPHAKTLDRNGLMRLVFPTWAPKGTAANQTVSLPADSSQSDKTDETEARVSPLHVVRLDDTHAVMVTETVAVDEHSEPMNCHACSANLGAYFFSHDDKGWRLDARQDSVGTSGVNGAIGTTRVERLGNAFVVFAEWGSCWQGNCGSWLEAFGFWPGKAKSLTPGIPLDAENSGAVGDCDNTDPELGATQPCFDVSSKWAVRQGHVVIDFKGQTQDPLDDDGKRPPAVKIATQARYALQGDELKLVAGSNPVPGL